MPSAAVSATRHRLAGLLAQHVERARDVGARGQPDRDVEPDGVGLERVVAQDPAGQPLVGDHDPLLGQRAQDREVQPHVLDDAVVLLERDPVADAQRLGDREHDPGDEVGERLAGGEADDRGHERARGEEAAGDPAEPLELRERGERRRSTSSTSQISRRTKRSRVSACWVMPPRSTRPGEPAPAGGEPAVEDEGEQDEEREDDARPRIAGCSVHQSSSRRRPCRRSLDASCSTRWAPCSRSSRPRRSCGPRCAPRRAPTWARRRRGAAIARGDRPLPRPPARGRRRGRPRGAAPASAEAMRPALPEPAASLRGDALTAALLDALRFHAYPEVPGTLASCARRGIRLVVVSNWDVSLHERLAETGLAPLLDGAVASAEFGAAKPDPAHLRPRRWSWRAPRRRRPGTPATRPRPTSPARSRRALTPVLVARRRRARAARRRADRGARRPTLLAGWLASRPLPAPSRCCAPSCRTGSRRSASRRSRPRAVRARRAARVAAVGAVRGDAGDARDRDPRRGAGDARRAARGLRRHARATRRRA